MSTNHNEASRSDIATTCARERVEGLMQVERLAFFVAEAAYEDLSEEAPQELKIREY
jgi:cell division protein FtsX